MLYVFHGEDDYTVHRRAAEAVARHSDVGSFGSQLLDGTTSPWSDVVAACSVLPFFSPRQVVHVRGLIAASARRRSAFGDDTAKAGVSPQALAALVSTMPATTVLVLEEGALPATNAHLKALLALDVEKTVQDCRVLVGEERVKWVLHEVSSRGGGIDGAAAAMLAQRVSGSLWPLAHAVETLICYAGTGGTISTNAVQDLILSEEDDNVFHLSDAIAAKHVGRALTLLHGLMIGGMVEEQLMAILVGRIRDWTLVAACRADGVSESDAMARLGWRASKYRAAVSGARAFARGELARAYQALLIADEALKSRPGDERTLIMDMLVVTLASRSDAEGLRQMFPVAVLA